MTRRMQMEELTAIAVPSQPALSPDGSRVVYVLRTLDGEGDRNVDQLWTVPAAPPADLRPRRHVPGLVAGRQQPRVPARRPGARACRRRR
jgi:hypothetical protein